MIMFKTSSCLVSIQHRMKMLSWTSAKSGQQKHWIKQWFGVNRAQLQLLWPSAGGTCCWSVLTVLRNTNPCVHSRCLGKHSSGTLLSQALVQYLLLVAVVYKAVLQLSGKKDTETQPAGASPLQGNRLGGEEKYTEGRKQSISTGDVKCKGFRGMAEVNFRHMQQLWKDEQDTSVFC